jgi:hypothetical protein
VPYSVAKRSQAVNVKSGRNRKFFTDQKLITTRNNKGRAKTIATTAVEGASSSAFRRIVMIDAR